MKTITSIKQHKGKTPLSVITAYDALFASLFDQKVDIILVGDSLNMSFNAKPDTLSASMEVMLYHTKAVCAGAKETFIVCDMPFGTYTDEKSALFNASLVYSQTNAHAVKIEGGVGRAHIIQTLTQNSIAVMAHIGLMPQYVRSEGGYKVRGRSEEDILALIEDAKAVEKAGAFSVVIEGVVEEAAKRISEAISIPTIGIGAGKYTDGQVLVWSDMLGFFQAFKPKFVKRYLDGATLVQDAVDAYVKEVQTRQFPDTEYTYQK
ncbi:3-methyl-2-oxobutanoate hydroxymethyltransferase [Sulfurospirillum barnesii]|uniref:3-methyl-2-oxobutanoate hydroxymethyltransferase n=1 Tax=Sulfurospirillum barnesii (strain ATCC 700032 / DSM 10660 / SES-3) TaxID=760154 RepID=I3XUZ0_SULBS|nr:3-methyl-2-oxobutanoate hydroxymethyltransferase [Sulfurospirillum barnesii]AFL67764.1 ketopantoate hydroxymethyltransferase [Sulfurospirillum barnesii SES-3]